MKLTMEQKEDLIRQYDLLIWSTVHHFKRRYSNVNTNVQDLYQEAVVAFLTHVEKHRPDKDLFIFPFRDVVNALCRHTLVEQTVSSPKRTTDYSRRIASLPGKAEMSSLAKQGDTRFTAEDMLTKVYFEQFISSLPLMDQRIIRLKLDGYRNREVAAALGVPDFKVSRRLHRMQKIYHAS